MCRCVPKEKHGKRPAMLFLPEVRPHLRSDNNGKTLSGGPSFTFRHQLLKILKAQRGTLRTAPYHGYYDSLRCRAASPHVLQRYLNQGGALVHSGAPSVGGRL